MTVNFAPVEDFPDLIFGLVGPIGVDLEYIQQSIEDSLKAFNYAVEPVKVTDVMREVKSTVKIDEHDLARSYHTKIDYANDLRKTLDAKDILAALVVSAISRLRADRLKAGEKPRGGCAYVIRQLKTPEEVRLLRSVYGRQFIQVSIYGAPQKRIEFLVSKIKIRSHGTKNDDVARTESVELIERDYKEEDNDFGQNIRGAFPLGDVFVDSNQREAANASIDRFMNALFGSNEVSPTHDEYGMYLAKMASLRSSDLSRQVGAALFRESGEIISLGCNEVPRSGGGTYWTGDPSDSRDFRQAHDPNEINKVEVFADLIKRLLEDKLLSNELLALKDASTIVDNLFKINNGKRYRELRVMDIIEFGRIIHAEMSSICDAARSGIPSRNSTMFVTTFPCHMCAKLILASGVRKVVYLEPYPKSYARQLHSDFIQIDDVIDLSKVTFEPFIGISPYRYRDLFEKGKRKGDDGEAKKWMADPRRPMIDVVFPAYIEAEKVVISKLGTVIAEKEARTRSSKAKKG